MRLSNITIILLISVLMFSIFVANLANLINVDVNYVQTTSSEKKERHFLKMTDNEEHLLWFLQITDIHVSIFHDLSRISDLKEFCDKTVPVFEPPLVIASGDLTDAKESNNIGSRQYEEEWISYYNALEECRNKTVWLDIRGNHDNFNIAGPKSHFNYYLNYSVQGMKHPRSYKYDMQFAGDKYSFIGIDACINPGPKRPFNFVGILKPEEMNSIENMTENARSDGTNYTIWFGHYPTSSILSPPHRNIRAVLGKYHEGYVYLCGHFHQLGGLIPNMYTLQKDGFLELELGDWKDNRVYRLLAMDHGLLSFVDIKHNDWPVILFTNPKNALFDIPQRENRNIMLESTHIRVLVFSPQQIAFVKVKINNEDWIICKKINKNLYVAQWNPYVYRTGLHYISAIVEDHTGHVKEIREPFSLDGTRLSFGILPRIILMFNMSQFFQFMFGIMLIFCIVPLCILRYLSYPIQGNKVRGVFSKNGYPLIRKLWILSTIDRLFYPIIFYTLYISVGPWSVGYIIEDYIGVIFVWGIFINNSFLPGSFTYAYGFLQLFTFHMPLIIILGNMCDVKLNVYGGKITLTRFKRAVNTIPFFIVLSLQILFAYFFWLAYGTLAFTIGPLRTWSVLLALWLWHQANTLPESSLSTWLKVLYSSKSTRSQRDVNLHQEN